MKKILAAHYLFLLLVIVGCTTIGLPNPQDFNDKLTAGYSAVSAINDSATKLLNAKKISSDDAQQILDQTRNARVGLDIARTVHKTDSTGADNKLAAIRTALSAITAYLTTKEK